jgi:dephospho-CoA kinase
MREMPSCDLLVIAGAPGSGKTTVCDLLYAALQSPYIDFGDVRNFHLDRHWSNQSPEEEQMSFENLIFILKNYVRYGYKNVILNDLKDFRVQQIPELFAGHNYLIATLITEKDDELATRIRNRNSGFTNVERALNWNKEIQQRPLLAGEYRIDNSYNDAQQTADKILQLARRNEAVI